ncbi:MAG: sugar phosphate isomerase/epimerase [Eubacteriales bacterium]|nr:sugar phosphate isomerase/epimerase [Eubacteriales bacterium]
MMDELKLGVVTRSFAGKSDEEIAQMMADNNLMYTELCFTSKEFKYWVYNGRSDISGVTDEMAAKVVKTYRDKGISITALGVFTNLIEPDANERSENIRYFKRHIDMASFNGIPYVSTECGFTPHQRGVNTDRYESDFSTLLDGFRELASYAAPKGVAIALEACVIDIVPSAKRCADFIKQTGMDNVKVLLDPANYIANSSEEDMFRYLAPNIAYFHAKDRKINATKGCCVGDGDINWPYFFSLYRKYTPHIPVIMEYVNATNYLEIAGRVKDFYSKSIILPGEANCS